MKEKPKFITSAVGVVGTLVVLAVPALLFIAAVVWLVRLIIMGLGV